MQISETGTDLFMDERSNKSVPVFRFPVSGFPEQPDIELPVRSLAIETGGMFQRREIGVRPYI
jgi:hypothetical protein